MIWFYKDFPDDLVHEKGSSELWVETLVPWWNRETQNSWVFWRAAPLSMGNITIDPSPKRITLIHFAKHQVQTLQKKHIHDGLKKTHET
jgi:hypothetical protein